MFSLRRRRVRGNMIDGMDKVNLRKLFCINEDERTRKHILCLKIRRHVNSNIGLNFFIKSY